MVQIIAGVVKGKKLKTVKGKDFRPTTGIVKEFIFNYIRDLKGFIVLDLFAGSGNLGIEALSRGAEKAVFIDNSGKSVDIIRYNLKLTGFESKSEVVKTDAWRYISGYSGDGFDLVFADPPYKSQLRGYLSDGVKKVLKGDGLFILEHTRFQSCEVSESLQLEKERTFGETRISIFRFVNF